MFVIIRFSELVAEIPDLKKYTVDSAISISELSRENIIEILNCICSSEYYQTEQLHFKQILDPTQPLRKARLLFANLNLYEKLQFV